MSTSDTFAADGADLGPAIETVRANHPRGPFRAALFDFDGTLSLIRRGWQDVMIPMMVRHLAETGTSETAEQIRAVVEDFVARLTGRQTIYQMIQLAEDVRKRGGTAREPLEYKHEYHELLWRQVGERVENLRTGAVKPDELAVPGSRALLAALGGRGIALYLASGTDLKYVQDEVDVLGMTEFFAPHIYGALDDYQKFSKAMIIERILGDMNVAGSEVIGFGDGYVEIEEVKRVGGLAIGVATNEETCRGVNQWKRRRLIEAGADIIVGDYRELGNLLETVGIA
ncbi:MAG: haloacid dehalogenase [Planctomycetota bacterium]|nr:MAG: haloacid dehalogenase [Planctomycetota bacterium]